MCAAERGRVALHRQSHYTLKKKGMHKLIKSDMVVMEEILRICISRSTHQHTQLLL